MNIYVKSKQISSQFISTTYKTQKDYISWLSGIYPWKCKVDLTSESHLM